MTKTLLFAFLIAAIILPISVMDYAHAASAADFVEDFESYSPGTQIPTGWTYEYSIKQPKTPEINTTEVTNSTGDNVYKIYLGAIREWPSPGSPGRITAGTLQSPVMEPHMQGFSLDILGKNLRGDGGEHYTGAVVGYGVIYDTDSGIKAINVRTHALNDKGVPYYFVYNGTMSGANKTLTDYTVTLDGGTSLTPSQNQIGNNTSLDSANASVAQGVWKHVTNNAKTLYNDNDLGDYDSDVNGWMLTLGGSSNTSQINGGYNKWEGQYDNIRINSTATYCGQPKSFYNSTIQGTDSTEILLGTAGNDLILGLDGNDLIRGLEGNDCIYGGDGNDLIDTGDGDDTVYAGNGTNAVRTGPGDDTVYTGDGDDFIQTAKGNDTVYAGNGTNMVSTGPGDDTVYTGDGNDYIQSGKDDDIIYAGSGNDTVWSGYGDDTVYGEAGNDILYFHSGNNTVDGGAGDFDICDKNNSTSVVQVNATNCEIT